MKRIGVIASVKSSQDYDKYRLLIEDGEEIISINPIYKRDFNGKLGDIVVYDDRFNLVKIKKGALTIGEVLSLGKIRRSFVTSKSKLIESISDPYSSRVVRQQVGALEQLEALVAENISVSLNGVNKTNKTRGLNILVPKFNLVSNTYKTVQ